MPASKVHWLVLKKNGIVVLWPLGACAECATLLLVLLFECLSVAAQTHLTKMVSMFDHLHCMMMTL